MGRGTAVAVLMGLIGTRSSSRAVGRSRGPGRPGGARIRRSRRLGIVFAAVLVAMPAVTAAASPRTRDITGTTAGEAIRGAAAQRFSTYGVAQDPLRVWDLGDGSLLVAPDWLSDFQRSASRLPDGTLEVGTGVIVGRRLDVENGGPLLASLAPVTTAAAPYWSLRENGCFSRIVYNHGYFDTCYKIYKLINDGVAGKDFYALYHYGTVGMLPGEPGTIDWAQIWSDQASGSSAMTWSDWGPRGDLTQGQGTCTNWTVGVSVGAVLQVSKWACEKWDMTKWADAAHYRMEWNCNCFFGITDDREVAYMTEITVATGGGPLWSIGATFNA